MIWNIQPSESHMKGYGGIKSVRQEQAAQAAIMREGVKWIDRSERSERGL
jgi:hypothetical protein